MNPIRRVTAIAPSTRVALALASLVCVAACRQVLGIETRTEGDPPVALGEACGACVDATCSDAERACAADPGCAKAAACMVEAGLDKPFGRATCREQHAKAVATSAFAAIDACMRADCQAECYGGTGFFAAYSPECQLCTEQSCGDKPSRCVADAQCEALAVEAYEAGPLGHDPASITALTTATGDEGEEERELGYCPINKPCPLECEFDGNNLGCVSAYEWPRSLGATATVELQVGVFNLDSPPTPLPHAVVDACRPASGDCIPIGTSEADAGGLAKGSIPLDGNAGFRGFFRIRSSEIDGKETIPLHLFGYPITRDTRGSALVFRWDDAETVAGAIAGGLRLDRAQFVVQFFDCSARQAETVTLSVPPGVMEDATPFALEDGLFAIYNAQPGCFDIVGHDPMGRETHRMRVLAVPGLLTWAYVNPLSSAPATGYMCTPTFE